MTRNFGVKPACQIHFSPRQVNLLGVVILGAAALLIVGGGVVEAVQIAFRAG
jgi:hypothetical protein